MLGLVSDFAGMMWCFIGYLASYYVLGCVSVVGASLWFYCDVKIVPIYVIFSKVNEKFFPPCITNFRKMGNVIGLVLSEFLKKKNNPMKLHFGRSDIAFNTTLVVIVHFGWGGGGYCP